MADKKPEQFVATKQIFINGVLHEPGQVVTVFPVDDTAIEKQVEANNSDGLVAVSDFDPASIIPVARGTFAGPITMPTTAVVTSAGTLPADVATAVVVEEEVKPRAAAHGKTKVDALS